MMDNVQVKKRDGTLESWSYDKLVTSITKTGIPMDDAENLASKIEGWVRENASIMAIDSITLRDRVFEEIKQIDPAAADTYQAYKKE